jgi:hypothetical protein
LDFLPFCYQITLTTTTTNTTTTTTTTTNPHPPQKANFFAPGINDSNNSTQSIFINALAKQHKCQLN